MIDPSRNHFELFGLPVTFRIEAGALEAAYRALQAQVHPDRYAGASDAKRRLALQSSAQVNEAYRMLRDPVERARYLLAMRGVDAFDETNTRLPLEFLEVQLERRERAADAAASRNIAGLDTILGEVRAEFNKRQQSLAALLDDPGAVLQATGGVRELRFLAKVAEDVDAMIAGLD